MVRFDCPRTVGTVLLVSFVSVAAASAQELPAPTIRHAADAAVFPSVQPPHVSLTPERPQDRRPGALVPLYVSFGAFQLLDAHSTSRALSRGAVESNPMMKAFAGNQAALLAVKAAGTSGVIYVSEKMWKKNKAAAVVFMVAANSAMAWVVQHNYRAVR